MVEVGDGAGEVGEPVGGGETTVVPASFLYRFRRLPPPQYSVWLPLQSILQPLAAGSARPGATTEPAPKVLPQ